jgi:hypothetical protein
VNATPAVFRLPRTTYLVVLFVALGTIPLAFTAAGYGRDNSGRVIGPAGVLGWQILFLVVPVLAAVFIARWATFVDESGIRVRAAFGSRLMSWDEIRGLSIDGNDVYAVLEDGAVRLPCVHVNTLAAVSRAAAGHLPPIANPRAKAAPQRKRAR